MVRLCEKCARFALPKMVAKMVEGLPGCPSGPSITCSSSTLAGDFGPLHRGPISRPYPTREPLLIGAPRAGSAEPTDGQAIAASDTTIRNCIQCQQETIKLRPRYSTFAQHPPRLMQNPLTRITPHRNPAVQRAFRHCVIVWVGADGIDSEARISRSA
jgi:hypothetical protein